jgi:hypothetical protein
MIQGPGYALGHIHIRVLGEETIFHVPNRISGGGPQSQEGRSANRCRLPHYHGGVIIERGKHKEICTGIQTLQQALVLDVAGVDHNMVQAQG